MSTSRMKLGAEVGINVPEGSGEPLWLRYRGLLGALLAMGWVVAIVLAAALFSGVKVDFGLLNALFKWTPFIFEGFLYNVAMSVVAMTVGTIGGIFLGMGQLSRPSWISLPSKTATQIFRNAPWLVLLFYCIFLVPFEVSIGSQTFQIPNWLRATIGFSIPVVANFSEVVRGAVQSIPSGQWEAARSLGYTWSRTMLSIVLPQCIKRMLPPWMNLYAVLTMATPLASIVGVEEAMNNARTALQAEADSRLLLPMYAFLLSWFFIYCYPIARFSMYLEGRFETR